MKEVSRLFWTSFEVTSVAAIKFALSRFCTLVNSSRVFNSSHAESDNSSLNLKYSSELSFEISPLCSIT